MLKYIPFYFHDFFDDPRVQQLTDREQQQWLMILARMMLSNATLPESPKYVAKLLDIPQKKAKEFIVKLKTLGLLQMRADMLMALENTRLTIEYNYAKHLWDKKSNGGKLGAAKRWNQDQNR